MSNLSRFFLFLLPSFPFLSLSLSSILFSLDSTTTLPLSPLTCHKTHAFTIDPLTCGHYLTAFLPVLNFDTQGLSALSLIWGWFCNSMKDQYYMKLWPVSFYKKNGGGGGVILVVILSLTLKRDGRQFPCAECLPPDLKGMPFMDVQVSTKQARGPIKKYPLFSQSVFGWRKCNYIMPVNHETWRLIHAIDNTCYWVNARIVSNVQNAHKSLRANTSFPELSRVDFQVLPVTNTAPTSQQTPYPTLHLIRLPTPHPAPRPTPHPTLHPIWHPVTRPFLGTLLCIHLAFHSSSTPHPTPHLILHPTPHSLGIDSAPHSAFPRHWLGILSISTQHSTHNLIRHLFQALPARQSTPNSKPNSTSDSAPHSVPYSASIRHSTLPFENQFWEIKEFDER